MTYKIDLRVFGDIEQLGVKNIHDGVKMLEKLTKELAGISKEDAAATEGRGRSPAARTSGSLRSRVRNRSCAGGAAGRSGQLLITCVKLPARVLCSDLGIRLYSAAYDTDLSGGPRSIGGATMP
ncbi:hypothetical protein [Streptosporangium sp. KLBMP 9127]|nr:hypothetical protein [Streptosporangium sp. KLBMP 9127]